MKGSALDLNCKTDTESCFFGKYKLQQKGNVIRSAFEALHLDLTGRLLLCTKVTLTLQERAGFFILTGMTAHKANFLTVYVSQ